MIRRRAECACGSLHLETLGEPVRASVCHCHACQRRTGSAFGAQARFRREQVVDITGEESLFHRTGDAGGKLTFHFCPKCGSTLYFEMAGDTPPFTSEFLAVTLGCFADAADFVPQVSIYEARKHAWVALVEHEGLTHLD